MTQKECIFLRYATNIITIRPWKSRLNTHRLKGMSRTNKALHPQLDE